MKTPLFTLAAAAGLLLCLAAWVRSYLPEYSTVRVHRGSLLLVLYGRDQAIYIDPARNPAFERPPRRWDTERVLTNARSWADRDSRTSKPRSWRALGFELIFNHNSLSQGYLVLAVPLWFIALPLAGVTVWGVTRWRREQKWRRENRCRTCGYDLRDSPAACPECGTAAAPTPPLPAPSSGSSTPRK